MNLHPFHSIVGRIQFRIVLLLVAGIVFNFCAKEPQLWKEDSQQQVMGEYISNNPDQFSEFDKLIKSTGKGSLLNTRGPFTLFLPTDGAMLDYYKQRNVNTLEDISDSEQAELILNHIVGASIPANEIGLGTLRETNALGDHLVTEFE